MSREMLINTVEGQECRIAIVEDGVLEELYIERASSASKVGNIYKGRVTNVEPSIQAAFVDFGTSKNGFLHISDINPQYFPKGDKNSEAVGRKRPHRDRPPIQECIRRGQELVVQVTKEGIGTKGPTLTTYLSIPGRLLVMMPGMSRLGVSRKIDDEEARQQARQVLAELKPPPDMGFILRTAGLDRSKRDLQRDLNYLTRLWKAVKDRIKASKAPAEIYQESDLVTRTVRDVYNSTVERVVCDSEDVALKVKEFLDVAMPRSKHVIELYVGGQGLFHDFGLEREIEKIYSRRVELRSGGSIVIDQAEALVAIDVNSGRFRDHSDAETTAMKINSEAAREIARQLRLRDMGGVIIIDFIDMRDAKNQRAVEKALRDAIKNDRAKTKILKISSFGIVEMTRQRVRPSLKDSIYGRCSCCDGTGLIKSEESQALTVMRNIQRAASIDEVANVEVAVTASVAQHMFNYQRHAICALENSTGRRVTLKSSDELTGDQVQVACTTNRGSAVAWEQPRPGEEKSKQPKTVPVEQLPLAAPAGAAPGARVEPAAPQTANEGPVTARTVAAEPETVEQAEQPPSPEQPTPSEQPEQPPAAAEGDKKKRRRGRRGGRKHKKKTGLEAPVDTSLEPAEMATPVPPPEPGQADEQVAPSMPAPQPSQPPQRAEPAHRRQVTPPTEAEPQPEEEPAEQADADQPPAAEDESAEPQAGDAAAQKKKRRRGKRGGRKHKKKTTAPEELQQGGE